MLINCDVIWHWGKLVFVVGSLFSGSLAKYVHFISDAAEKLALGNRYTKPH